MTTKKKSLVIALALLAATVSADSFNNLFKVLNPIGDCKIKRPGDTEFVPVIKGKAYPLGSSVSCGLLSSATLQFSDLDAIHIFADTVVTPEKNEKRGDGIAIDFKNGSMTTKISPACTNDEYVINTTLGSCVSMTGNNKIALVRLLDAATIELRAEKSSSLRFVGPQFIIPKLQNGCGVSVSTQNDNSFTRITDLFGDLTALVNGTDELNPPVGDEGSDYVRAIKLSTGYVIKLWRERAPVGGRIIISALAMSANGEIYSHYSQAVGRKNITAIENLKVKQTPKAEEGAQNADDPMGGLEDAFGDGAAIPEDGAADEAAEAPAAEENNDDFLLNY